MRIRTVLAGSGIVALSLVAATPPCCPEVAAAPPGAAAQERLATVRLDIEGMTCGGCAVATRAALRKLDGVEKVEVSYEKHSAVVTYNPAKVTVARILKAVRDAGFTPKVAG
ncbi:MAG: heavy-metal-associated domain-containing protein [Gemmatimonadota bacterium]